MGWRKLTIPDGDLARCSDLSATEEVRRTPIWGIMNCSSISLTQWPSEACLTAGWSDPWTCSNCSLLVQ
jgi:hypothetical protein